LNRQADRLQLVWSRNSPSTRAQRLYRRQPVAATGSFLAVWFRYRRDNCDRV